MYDPAQPRSRVFLPAILSGILLYAAFFPLNLGFLAWIALVPLLSLVRANARSRRIYFAAFVGGLFLYVPAIQWIRVAHPAMYGSWVFLAVVCSLFLVLTLAFVRKLDRAGVPLWLAAPISFIAVEYLRSHFPTGYTWMELFDARHPIGFGWYMIGHTQHDYVQLIQIADLTGAYGVTFLVVLVNAAIWNVASQSSRIRAWLRISSPLFAWERGAHSLTRRSDYIAMALLLLTFTYGVLRTNHDEFAQGPTVALIQGNLPQDVKNLHGDEMVQHFETLADEAVKADAQGKKPDLVIWPETSFALHWFEASPNSSIEKLVPSSGLPPKETTFLRNRNFARELIRSKALEWPVPTLYGLNSYQWEADGSIWRYNTALFVDRHGVPTGRYDKIHLVPLGEYVPFEKTFPFLKAFTPYDTTPGEETYSCRPGDKWTRFPLPVGERTYQFACLICYEDTDASLARHYVRPGSEPIDFFVNISNDGWFDGTAEHEQHLAIARFRCIESRRSMVRAVNMGISAIIDSEGRVIALPGETWSKSKKVEGIVRGKVPLDTRTTLYGRFGDWLPLTAWFVILATFVRGFVRRKQTAPHG